MKNNKFLKLAQVPTAASGPPPLNVAPAVGLPPPPTPTGGLPTMPMAGAQTNSTANDPGVRKELTVPLSSIGQILYDADATEIVENNISSSPQEISTKIWMMYGGDEMGGADSNKVGERSEEPLEGETIEIERKNTQDARWKRLPKGKTIADVIGKDDLEQMMTSFIMSTIKKTATESAGAAAPPGGGMPPMMAKSNLDTIRLAQILDNCGYFSDADYFDSFIQN